MSEPTSTTENQPAAASEAPPDYLVPLAESFRFIAAKISEADQVRRKASESTLVHAKGKRLPRIGKDQDLLRQAQRLDLEAQEAIQQFVLSIFAPAILAMHRGQAYVDDSDGTARLLAVVRPAIEITALQKAAAGAEPAAPEGYETVPDDELERMREAKAAAALVPEPRAITGDLPTIEED